MKALQRLALVNNHLGATHKIWVNNLFGNGRAVLALQNSRGFSSSTAPPTSVGSAEQNPSETDGSSANTLNRFSTGVFLNPHFAKRFKGGEDAACINDRLICVADGVGGWAESGIDPALYSKQLCSIIDVLFRSGDERYLMSPKQLLVDAVKKNQEIGSCTCCLLVLDEKAKVLQSCNLGDSGYMILRGEEAQTSAPSDIGKELLIRYETKEQQHSFNFPYQCGTNGDDPMKGESMAHNVEHGDIIVLGSDGLWDNLHRATIVDMIRPHVKWTAENKYGMI